MADRLTIEVQSQADLAVPERLEAIGSAFDAHPRLAPDRAGLRDPPKTPVKSLAEHLVAWDPPQKRGRRDDQFLARVSPPQATGLLSLAFPPWPRKLWVSYDMEALEGPDQFDAVAALLKRLAEEMDAFYGFAATNSMLKQEADLREAARRADGPRPNLGSGPYFISERGISDVYWLNYFGPATIEKWGRKRLEGLGIRRQSTTGGGLLVWATPSPVGAEEGVAAMSDYPWKGAFYDALGRDTFIHEGWQDPGAGVRVPTFEEHRLATSRREPA
jgi:hypothetical protein